MASEFLAGLSLFKSMMDTAKGLKNISDATVRNSVAIELQEKILAAQEAQTALIERVGELEKEVASFETWDREKERYELTDLPPGVFVYAVKEEARGSEPPHYACANCFGKRQKSVINKSEPINGRTELHCPSCGWKGKIGKFAAPQVQRGGGSWMGN